MIRESDKKVNRRVAVALFAFFLVLYISTAAPGVNTGDTGEITAAINSLGLAHSTGFPLYIIAAKAFTFFVPTESFAFRVNIFSSVITAITIAILFLALRQFRLSGFASILGAVVLGLGRVVWIQAGLANVYPLSLFFATTLLWFFAKWRSNKNPNFVAWYALLWGASFGTHILMATMVVPLIIMLWHSRNYFETLKIALRVLALFLLPFVVYFYLPVAYAKNTIVNLGEINNLGGFINYITQRDYASKIFYRTPTDSFSFLKNIVSTLSIEFAIIFLTTAVAGFIITLKKDRTLLVVLAGMTILNLLIMFSYGNEHDIKIINRYLFTTYLAVAIFAAFGTNWLQRSLHKNKKLKTVILTLLVLAVVFEFRINFSEVKNINSNSLIPDFVDNILTTVEPNSILLSAGDAITGPLWYTQSTGTRRDITIVDINLLGLDWYIRNLSRANPKINFPETKRLDLTERFIALVNLNMDKKPIYTLANPASQQVKKEFDFFPIGLTNKIFKKNTLNAKKLLPLSQNNWDSYKMAGVKSDIYKDESLDQITKFYAIMLNNLGTAYYQNGFRVEAIDTLEKSLRINPDPLTAKNLEIARQK